MTDHLGTPRMVVDETGALAGVSRRDYLPFGEELQAGVGGRTASQGYSQFDGVRQKFTSKERDDETGLDYFGARYYASTQGRFTSPDPLFSSGRTEDPQTWNRYGYTLNNPLKYTDPSGLFEWVNEGDDVSKEERQRREKFIKAFNDLKKLRDQVGKKLGNDSEEYKRLSGVITTLGEPGERTGVKVEFGPTVSQEPRAAETANILDISDPEKGSQEYIKITVDMDRVGGNKHLVEAIGHEGEHAVELNKRYLKAGESTYRLEFTAFEISSFIQEAQGDSRGYKGGGRVWRKEWSKVDRETLRAHRTKAINDLLSTNPAYGRARPPKP